MTNLAESERNGSDRLEELYNNTVDAMNLADTEQWYMSLAATFTSFKGFRDSESLAAECLEKAEPLRKIRLEKEEADRLEAEQVEKNRIATEKVKKRIKIFIAVITPIFCLMIALSIVLNTAIPKQRYNKAMELIEDGEFDKAYELLEALGKHEDVKQSKYDRAIKLLEEENFDEAYVLLEEAGMQDKVKQSKYDRALALIDSDDFVAAYELLNGLNYKDSTDKLASIRLQYEKASLSNAKVGSIVIFGSYEQDDDTFNGKEDILWLVLAKKDNQVLVISHYALDCQPYNIESRYVVWETCSLRKWLNEDFINDAFSPDESDMIQITTVTADKNPRSSATPGNDTTDKVFLLSMKEVNEYFISDAERQCSPTAYAEAQEKYAFVENGNCRWWLRSPGRYHNYATYVHCDGSFYACEFFVEHDGIFVRPALWISLE